MFNKINDVSFWQAVCSSPFRIHPGRRMIEIIIVRQTSTDRSLSNEQVALQSLQTVCLCHGHIERRKALKLIFDI